MSPGGPRSWGERIYGALLRLYPSSFRARFEHDMRVTFVRDEERARAQGPGAHAAFWTRGVTEAMRFGLAERFASRASATHPISGGASMVSRLAVDWRDGWRALRATPMVTMMAVVSLGLGIGANTALFSILNSLVLRTLPVRHPEQLTTLLDGSWTNPIWEQIRDRQTEIGAGAFAWSTTRFDLAPRGETDPIDGAFASGAIFDVLGLAPARGRLFTTADDVRGGPGVAVVSYAFWQKRLGHADDIVGRMITLDRVPFTIIGVTAREFTGLDVGRACDVFIPLANEPLVRAAGGSWLGGRSTWWLELMVRLRPGQSIEQANAALRAIQPQVREATIPPEYGPDTSGYLKEPWTLAPASTGRSGLRIRFQQPLVVMMIVVGAVLLIACANIANLMLARANARRRDLTVRLALGASRARIARQLLCESLLIAAGGAALGLVVAIFGSAFLVRQLATTYLDTSIDLRVLGFTAGVGLVTALVFGIVPALGAARLAPYEALKDQGRTIAGDRRLGFRNLLVVVQVGLSLALVVAAGLFIRTFQSLSTVPLGLRVEPLLNVSLDLRRTEAFAENSAARGAEGRLLYERLREAAAAVPGVKGAALSRIQLLTGGGWNGRINLPDGEQGRPGIRPPWFNAVTPGYFQMHGLRLVSGRDFTADDRIGRPTVAVVNEAFVRRFLNGQHPIGQHFLRGQPRGRQLDSEIVGVVSDSVYRSVRDGSPAIVYLALNQIEEVDSSRTLTVEIDSRSWGEVQQRLTQALTSVDGGVAITMRPFADRIRSTIAQEKLVAILSGFFGGLALLLAGVGLYGVTAYGVSRRRTEIGVRMALGAQPAGMVRLVLGRVAWLIGLGVIAGAAVSYWAAKFIGPALLFGLDARDARTFVIAALVLIVVGLVTAWLPARRASRIDPTTVLRES